MEDKTFLLTIEERKILKKIKKELKEDVFFNINIEDKCYEVFNDDFALVLRPEVFRYSQLKKNHTFKFTEVLKQIKKAKISDEISLKKYEIEESDISYKEDVLYSSEINKDFRDEISILSNYIKKIELFDELKKVHFLNGKFIASNLTSLAIFRSNDLPNEIPHFMVNATHLQMIKEFDFDKLSLSDNWLIFEGGNLDLFLKKTSQPKKSFFDTFQNLQLVGEKVSFESYLNKKEMQKIISSKLKQSSSLIRQSIEAEIKNNEVYIGGECVSDFQKDIKVKIAASDLLPIWPDFEWWIDGKYIYEKVSDNEKNATYIVQKLEVH